MIRSLQSWFIPSRHNKFHPHALRPIGLIVAVLVLAFIPVLYNATSHGKVQVLSYATDVSIGGVHSISNTQRTNNGVAPLSLNSSLNQAAANKAAHMFAHNYWAHVAPDGTTPWSFINGVGYSYSLAGENLAMNFSTSDGVVNGWMNSPGHRDNVLKSGYTDVGYGVANGVLQGQETTLVVAMYATPLSAPAPPPAPAPTTPPVQTNNNPTVTIAETPQPAETPPAPIEETVTEAQPVESSTPTQSTDLTTEPVPISPAESFGAVAGAIVKAPVVAYSGLNWGQKASLFVLSVLALLFIMKHTLIWRSQTRGLQHIWLRSHPLAQASFLIAASAVTLLSGTGTIL